MESGAVRAPSTMSAVVAVAAMVTVMMLTKTLLPKKFKPPAMFTLSNVSTKTGDTTGAWEARPAILALACAVRWRWKLII